MIREQTVILEVNVREVKGNITLGFSLTSMGLTCCWNNLYVLRFSRSASEYWISTSVRPKEEQTSSIVGIPRKT